MTYETPLFAVQECDGSKLFRTFENLTQAIRFARKRFRGLIYRIDYKINPKTQRFQSAIRRPFFSTIR